MKIRTFLIIIFLSLLPTACVNPAQKQSTGVKLNPTINNDASEFLNFAETFSNLTPEMQKQTLATTNQALALNPNELAQRMNLVMIYGLPSSNLLDTPKAQSLLQQILQEDILTNSQLAFAHVLFDYLVAANKVSKNNHEDSKRVELLLQKNETLQLKLDAAQQKLDELKKIEKSMGERESLPKESVPKK
jgi:vacuolar-type H+-ATPase catalytic subunit A/Vma1